MERDAFDKPADLILIRVEGYFRIRKIPYRKRLSVLTDSLFMPDDTDRADTSGKDPFESLLFEVLYDPEVRILFDIPYSTR